MIIVSLHQNSDNKEVFSMETTEPLLKRAIYICAKKFKVPQHYILVKENNCNIAQFDAESYIKNAHNIR